MQRFNNLGVILVFQGQLPPLTTGQRFKQLVVDFRVGLHTFGAFYSHLAHDHVFQTGIDVAVQNGQLIVAVTCQTFDFFTLDLQRTFVFFQRRGG